MVWAIGKTQLEGNASLTVTCGKIVANNARWCKTCHHFENENAVKLKLAFRMGFDFKEKDASPTRLNLYVQIEQKLRVIFPPRKCSSASQYDCRSDRLFNRKARLHGWIEPNKTEFHAAVEVTSISSAVGPSNSRKIGLARCAVKQTSLASIRKCSLGHRTFVAVSRTREFSTSWLLIAATFWCMACGLEASKSHGQSRLAGTTTSGSMGGELDYMPSDELVAVGRDDASLHDIAIVGDERLVAVGDRGTILISQSGGRTWELVPSGTTANLHAVRFGLDGRGIAVGGWIGSETRTSHAVILGTADGGQTWSPIPCRNLPRLTGVRREGNYCLAWGDYNPRDGTSLFESLNGGLTWNASPARIGHASAGAMSSSTNDRRQLELASNTQPNAALQIAAIDILGRGCFANKTVAGWSAPTTIAIAEPARPLLALHHTGSHWIACGAAGELITSVNGRDWTIIGLPLSEPARSLCNWQAIAQIGDEVWIGGMPGSIFLHSADRGETWNVRPTGQSLPITALVFADSYRGWATGPLGQILATRDGGKTWYAQRQRARRVGVLALAADHQDSPWSPMVAAAWDNEVAVVASVCAPDDAIDQADFRATPASQYSHVAPHLGIAGYHTWPSKSADPQHSSRRIALELLCWRPDVVLLSEGQSLSGDPSRQLTVNAFAAMQECMKPSAVFAQELRLSPWSVSKLVKTCDQSSCQFTETSARIMRSPGLAIWDLLLALPHSSREAAKNCSMQMVWAQSQTKAVSASLLGGIALTGECKRPARSSTAGNVQLILGRVHREKSVDRLVNSLTAEHSIGQWTSDLEFIVRTVPASELPAVLIGLAGRLHPVLNRKQHQVVLQAMMSYGPHSDEADWARLQSLTLGSSDELMAWKNSLIKVEGTNLQLADNTSPLLPVPSQSQDAPAKLATWTATPFGDAQPRLQALPRTSMVVPASGESPLPLPPSGTASHEAASWSKQLDQIRHDSPALLSRPDVQLLMLADARWSSSRGQPDFQSDLALENVLDAQQLIGWTQMARQELAIATNRTDALRWQVRASATRRPPLLDGRFDEAFWEAASSMQLATLPPDEPADATGQSTRVRWAFDDSYLYIGLDCQHHGQSGPAQVVGRREYDSDLGGLDHVQFTLDTNRDYCTAIELAVSADGRTYDRCCGFAAYNPKWHVFVHPSLNHWTAEIAIELDSLTTRTALAGSAWAVSVRRNNPLGPSQSWTQLRSHRPFLQSSGLLIFSNDNP